MPPAPATESFFAADRPAWRAWLEEHGAGAREIGLILLKKGVAERGLTYDEAVEEALCWGWIDGRTDRRDERSYVVRFTPRKPGSVWSESNVVRVERMIAEGRMTPAGQALVDEAKRRGTWQDAASGRLAVTPPDLEQALTAQPEAAAAWRAWPPSARRQYVYWVLDAKREETRARRVAEVVRRAAAGRPSRRREVE